MSDSRSTVANDHSASAGRYTVIARRYRPQTFDELVGQEHVARALQQAITSDRVGHAYLFTGARGVGKTSAARILAKALNCVHGPTPTPCNECDVCRRVAAGDDVDVLEIDGASNRGIDEIRQLRQNVAVRPSRVRFKIYIIDEVHMLTKEAFNALLKTLEEPPEHVKFIFATTEPQKIPITILSRCQRFDFAGISAASIRRRLAQIAAAEGVASSPKHCRFWPAGRPARCATASRCSNNCSPSGTGKLRPPTSTRCSASRPPSGSRAGAAFGGPRRAGGARGAGCDDRQRRRSRAVARSADRIFPRRDGAGRRLSGRSNAICVAVAGARKSRRSARQLGWPTILGDRPDSRSDVGPDAGEHAWPDAGRNGGRANLPAWRIRRPCIAGGRIRGEPTAQISQSRVPGGERPRSPSTSSVDAANESRPQKKTLSRHRQHRSRTDLPAGSRLCVAATPPRIPEMPPQAESAVLLSNGENSPAKQEHADQAARRQRTVHGIRRTRIR